MDHISRWLSDNGFAQSVVDSFAENDVDGSTLLGLTQEELSTDLGVRSLGTRKKLLDKIQLLTDHGSGSPYAQAVYTGRQVPLSPQPPVSAQSQHSARVWVGDCAVWW